MLRIMQPTPKALVYQDNEHQLYALKSVIKQAAR